VLECREAAFVLKDGAQVLSDVPRDLFEEKKGTLPENLRRRAEHFYGEVERVHRGAKAWEDSDMELFGRLMNQSCHSSIRFYESGSEILIQLHEIASGANGVYGTASAAANTVAVWRTREARPGSRCSDGDCRKVFGTPA
jgi:galactokinase